MKTIKGLIIISIVLILGSCEDKVDIDVPIGDENLVVGGMFLNVPNSEIILTKTAPYFEDGPTPRVTGADVYIIDDLNDTITLLENQNPDGRYLAPEAGVVGRKYSLHIYLPDGKSYASDFQEMKRCPPIDSVYYLPFDEVDNPFLEEGYVVLIDTQEPEGSGDFYRWMWFMNGVVQDGPEELLYASDEFVDGNYIGELEIAYDLQLGVRIDVMQLSVTERGYNYLELIDEQATNVGTPFDPPPSPIKGNVFNTNPDGEDALGFFFVSASSRKGVDLF